MNFKNLSKAMTCLIPLASLGQSASLAATTKVIGYYENWAIYNAGAWGSKPGTLPYQPTPLTWKNFIQNGQLNVLNYAFGTFNCNVSNGAVPNPGVVGYLPTGDWKLYYSDPNDNTNLNMVGQLQTMKTSNPDFLRVWSIGGWNFTQPQTTALAGTQYGFFTMPFFSMIANNQDVIDPSTDYALGAQGYSNGSPYTALVNYGRDYATYNNANRYGTVLGAPQAVGTSGSPQANFIASCASIINTPLWDGIDLDWEYPGRVDRGGIGATSGGGPVGDFTGLLNLLTQLRTALNPGKIISMATASAGSSPLLADVSWAAGQFADGTYYPSSQTVLAAYGINPANPNTDLFPRFGGNPYAYTYSSVNEFLYFLWMAICAHECDWFNVMTYDYYGPFFPAYSDPVTSTGPLNSHLAPLYPATWNSNSQLSGSQLTPPESPNFGPQSVCVDRTIGMYLNATIGATATGGPSGQSTNAISISPSKLMLGIPAYGRAFQNPQGTGTALTPGSTTQTQNANNETPGGNYSKQPGYYNYYEITDAASGVGNTFDTLLDDTTSCTSYAAGKISGEFCSFDYAGAPAINGQSPTNSVARKCQYALNQSLGGVMLWSLDCDDCDNTGVQGSGIFPVLNSVISGLTPNISKTGTPGQANFNYGPTQGPNN